MSAVTAAVTRPGTIGESLYGIRRLAIEQFEKELGQEYYDPDPDKKYMVLGTRLYELLANENVDLKDNKVVISLPPSFAEMSEKFKAIILEMYQTHLRDMVRMLRAEFLENVRVYKEQDDPIAE